MQPGCVLRSTGKILGLNAARLFILRSTGKILGWNATRLCIEEHRKDTRLECSLVVYQGVPESYSAGMLPGGVLRSNGKLLGWNAARWCIEK